MLYAVTQCYLGLPGTGLRCYLLLSVELGRAYRVNVN